MYREDCDRTPSTVAQGHTSASFTHHSSLITLGAETCVEHAPWTITSHTQRRAAARHAQRTSGSALQPRGQGRPARLRALSSRSVPAPARSAASAGAVSRCCMRRENTCRPCRAAPGRGQGPTGAHCAPPRGASRARRRPHAPPAPRGAKVAALKSCNCQPPPHFCTQYDTRQQAGSWYAARQSHCVGAGPQLQGSWGGREAIALRRRGVHVLCDDVNNAEAGRVPALLPGLRSDGVCGALHGALLPR